MHSIAQANIYAPEPASNNWFDFDNRRTRGTARVNDSSPITTGQGVMKAFAQVEVFGRDDSDVKAFVKDRFGLASLIDTLPDRVKIIFGGGCRIDLWLMHAVDGEDEDELVARIVYYGEGQDALDRMGRLRESWWGAESERWSDVFSLDVEIA